VFQIVRSETRKTADIIGNGCGIPKKPAFFTIGAAIGIPAILPDL